MAQWGGHGWHRDCDPEVWKEVIPMLEKPIGYRVVVGEFDRGGLAKECTPVSQVIQRIDFKPRFRVEEWIRTRINTAAECVLQ